MIFVMLVSLYTSRVVLATLGIEDYGIYNVVGGVVVMFGFLNGAMSASTSRYITFALGKGELGEQLKVFNTSLQIHLIIALLILLLAETVGLWFLQSKMIIAGDRQYAAFWVYQCSVLTMMASIINVPFNASIIAHERMSVFAYISIFEVISKLGIVYLLMIVPVDKLIFYAALLFAVQLLMQSVYMRYCVRHFEEVELKKIWSKPLFTEMLGFAGWNLMGNCAGFIHTRGEYSAQHVFWSCSKCGSWCCSAGARGCILLFQQFPNGTESADYQELCNRRFAGYAQSGIKECPFFIFSAFPAFVTNLFDDPRNSGSLAYGSSRFFGNISSTLLDGGYD